MRYSQISWLVDDKGLVGFFLRGEYCGEHECGIETLQSLFGVSDLPARNGVPIEGVLGIERRTATQVPPCMFYGSTYDQKRKRQKRHETLLVRQFSSATSNDELSLWNLKVAAAWCDSEFGIVAADAENKKYLAQIYEAILNCDVAMWVGGGTPNPFTRSGMSFVIVSRSDDEYRNILLQSDLERKRITDIDLATGIRDRIKASGRLVFDLNPSDNDMFPESAYPIKYWAQVVSGRATIAKYASVEHLDQWLNNEGPLTQSKLV